MRPTAQGLLAPPLTYGTVPAVVFVMFYQRMFSRSAILILVCCGLLLPHATAISADGRYQRTKDGKTMVWNDDPVPGDVAAWSGDRDAEGYADGFGTLTWYTGVTRVGKETLYAYYFGNMVRGKFNGPVNGHSKGVTNHALFSHGKRTTRWASGPTRSWSMPRGNTEPVATPSPMVLARAEPEKPADFNPPPTPVRASPSPVSIRTTNGSRPVPDYSNLQEQPAPSPTEDVPAEGPKLNPSETASDSAAQTSEPPKAENLEAVKALVRPPSSLRTAPSADSPAEQTPGNSLVPESRLKKEEVVALADAEARKRGYELNDYERPEPTFDPADQTWSLSYDRKSADDSAASNKHFAIAIDDETKRTAVVPSR